MPKASRRRPSSSAGQGKRQTLGRTSSRPAATPAHVGATRAPAGTRRRWLAGIVLVAVVAAVIGAWRVLPSLVQGHPASARPIASLDAPDVHSLLIDPANAERILFGSHSGVQESLDGGFAWQPTTLQNADAMSMAASLNDPQTVFLAGHDIFLVSRDGGASWRPVTHDLPGTDIHAFAQDPNDPRRLFALVVGAGVLSSADGGASWDLLPAQPRGMAMHGALATDGSTLYATTPEGLTASRDQGASWEQLAAQPGGGAISLAIAATIPQTLYAGTPSGLAKSSDGGASWVELGPAGVPVLALAVAPSDPNQVLFIDDAGNVYRSDDGGASWVAPR